MKAFTVAIDFSLFMFMIEIVFFKFRDDDKLLTFGLDRIDSVNPLPSHKYLEYKGDLKEIFEDIIGVTYYENSPVYKIVFWVSDYSKDYVLTKPLHESQKTISEKNELELRQKHPTLTGGCFF